MQNLTALLFATLSGLATVVSSCVVERVTGHMGVWTAILQGTAITSVMAGLFYLVRPEWMDDPIIAKDPVVRYAAFIFSWMLTVMMSLIVQILGQPEFGADAIPTPAMLQIFVSTLTGGSLAGAAYISDPQSERRIPQ